jgi:hypothetical protein
LGTKQHKSLCFSLLGKKYTLSLNDPKIKKKQQINKKAIEKIDYNIIKLSKTNDWKYVERKA